MKHKCNMVHLHWALIHPEQLVHYNWKLRTFLSCLYLSELNRVCWALCSTPFDSNSHTWSCYSNQACESQWSDTSQSLHANVNIYIWEIISRPDYSVSWSKFGTTEKTNRGLWKSIHHFVHIFLFNFLVTW